ncbi:unnamed protein product [Vitrella brassicaformis CCMP3155]|uniref:EF-hand domain-containing protein n=1 Tax=Vitrella brassicaformis (strain CCMP3155) TaxID=1169540 RepID=A0A0G4EBW3_VITBC|nr:unnamed protein product [Vitrella brassicaformis CCMP3155]|eukprot:CEL92795.1 unnamed protein product [Vitrella brassicaformis CCMP3155]
MDERNRCSSSGSRLDPALASPPAAEASPPLLFEDGSRLSFNSQHDPVRVTAGGTRHLLHTPQDPHLAQSSPSSPGSPGGVEDRVAQPSGVSMDLAAGGHSQQVVPRPHGLGDDVSALGRCMEQLDIDLDSDGMVDQADLDELCSSLEKLKGQLGTLCKKVDSLRRDRSQKCHPATGGPSTPPPPPPPAAFAEHATQRTPNHARSSPARLHTEEAEYRTH